MPDYEDWLEAASKASSASRKTHSKLIKKLSECVPSRDDRAFILDCVASLAWSSEQYGAATGHMAEICPPQRKEGPRELLPDPGEPGGDA